MANENEAQSRVAKTLLEQAGPAQGTVSQLMAVASTTQNFIQLVDALIAEQHREDIRQNRI